MTKHKSRKNWDCWGVYHVEGRMNLHSYICITLHITFYLWNVGEILVVSYMQRGSLLATRYPYRVANEPRNLGIHELHTRWPNQPRDLASQVPTPCGLWAMRSGNIVIPWTHNYVISNLTVSQTNKTSKMIPKKGNLDMETMNLLPTVRGVTWFNTNEMLFIMRFTRVIFAPCGDVDTVDALTVPTVHD